MGLERLTSFRRDGWREAPEPRCQSSKPNATGRASGLRCCAAGLREPAPLHDAIRPRREPQIARLTSAPLRRGLRPIRLVIAAGTGAVSVGVAEAAEHL